MVSDEPEGHVELLLGEVLVGSAGSNQPYLLQLIDGQARSLEECDGFLAFDAVAFACCLAVHV